MFDAAELRMRDAEQVLVRVLLLFSVQEEMIVNDKILHRFDCLPDFITQPNFNNNTRNQQCYICVNRGCDDSNRIALHINHNDKIFES